ncbi:aminotransferase [Tribonema minus]|uniref:Aminotransferase n=1 Tax=Tribonema minus TaxID=303371 RepID=A0A835YTB1_9STRA|nr:aminotransferase [Tribonema minus]
MCTAVTDPAFFVVPLDDHLVHRGHAVFDTCNVKNGRAYGLSFHLERFLRSAELARIRHPYKKEELRAIILRTIAATGMRDNIFVRYWMGAGRGDFTVTPKNSTGATFYVCVHGDGRNSGTVSTGPSTQERGRREFMSDAPLKPPLLAGIKSTNYLLNALCAMDSEGAGGALGIQADADGRVMESSIANIAIVDQCGVLRTPKFEGILAGTTVKRAFVLAPRLLEAGLLEGFELGDVLVEEFSTAQEVMSFGGGHCVPVVEINGEKIGSGTPGPVWQALNRLLEEDMEDSEYLDQVPYKEMEAQRRPMQRDAGSQRALAAGASGSSSSMRGFDVLAGAAYGYSASTLLSVTTVAALTGVILARVLM